MGKITIVSVTYENVVNKFASHAQLTFAPLYDKNSAAK